MRNLPPPWSTSAFSTKKPQSRGLTGSSAQTKRRLKILADILITKQLVKLILTVQ